MVNTNSSIQNLKSTEVSLKALKDANPVNLLNDYIENIEAKDIEKIKTYLGILYFLVLTLLSITLLM